MGLSTQLAFECGQRVGHGGMVCAGQGAFMRGLVETLFFGL